jgi:hypothetical protein
MKRAVFTMALALLALVGQGCIDQIDKYFKDKGVNRLAVPRTDVRPGRLIVAKDNKLRLSDEILDVVPTATLPTQGFEAAFSAGDYNSEIAPSMGLKVIDAVLPLGLNTKVKLTNSAKIEQINAHGQRLPAPAVVDLLNDPANGPKLRAWLEALGKNATVGVVLETYLASEINMSSASGYDIAAGLTLGEKTPFKSGSVDFNVTKSAKNTLVIKGDTYYVFGLKAYAFEFDTAGKVTSLSDTVLDLSAPMVGKGLVLGGPTPAPDTVTFGKVAFE